jgi:hypothetical protein
MTERLLGNAEPVNSKLVDGRVLLIDLDFINRQNNIEEDVDACAPAGGGGHLR